MRGPADRVAIRYPVASTSRVLETDQKRIVIYIPPETGPPGGRMPLRDETLFAELDNLETPGH